VQQTGNGKSENVVVTYADPSDRNLTPAAAREVTKKQSEAAIAHLKGVKADRVGRFSANKKMTPLGMGFDPPPVAEKDPPAAPNLQILVFTPQ
jgi:hypothetical protein